MPPAESQCELLMLIIAGGILIAFAIITMMRHIGLFLLILILLTLISNLGH